MVVGAASVGLLAAVLAGIVWRPTPRLATRVRPYTVVARTSLGRSADLVPREPRASTPTGLVARVFVPPLRALATRLGGLLGARSDEQLRLRLRQAGRRDVSIEEHRVRSLGTAVLCGAVGAVPGIVLHQPILTLGLGACGLVYGAARARGRLDRAIGDRRERIRLELYTVNQLLAINLRTGAGPLQATQRIVDRGTGAMVEELDEVLAWVRSGMAEHEAFERAADLSPEPNAARTYKLIATGTERGADLALALRALSEDLRDARRDDLRKTATKRRAAMLVPTIAILAPVMLLFIAAPLPSIIFGGR
jgi:Flp pilus assembly protein TadB